MPVKIEQVYRDLDISSQKQLKLHRKMKEDFEFALGHQWDDKDSEKLRQAGVLPLTINQIKPLIKIITGIERQSRSDYQAFPEGAEDELISEVLTRLLKNVVKRSLLDKKLSDTFKEGMTGGLCFIEPYIDYTYDLINGEMKFRKVNARQVFFAPEGEEYDLSDRKYVIKITYNLSKDDLLEIFPEDEKKIEKVGSNRRVDFKNMDAIIDYVQKRDYEFDERHRVNQPEEKGEGGYDLIEYYYKEPVARYFLADRETGEIKEYRSRSEADAALEELLGSLANQGGIDPTRIEERFVIIKKMIPEIRLKQVVGGVEFSDNTSWSYPRWKFYPLIPFYAERMTVDIDQEDLLVQGIVRSLKDLQLELNKTRTLELRHINQSANSGFMTPKGAFDIRNKKALESYGSTPGVHIEYDPQKTGGVVDPERFRIRPAPLPQGHMALSAERINDIKQTSGLNPDLLANDSQSQSGRAILLKQRQGLIMVQEALDNYSETKKLLGRFILSQLGEVYTVETAMRVLGEDFIKEHFERPQTDQFGQPLQDEQGQLVMKVDPKEVALFLNQILVDSELGKYDVSIGEGAYNETIKFTNFMTLMEMIQNGMPIPPDIIIQESLLSEGQKEKILSALEAQRQAQVEAQRQMG